MRSAGLLDSRGQNPARPGPLRTPVWPLVLAASILTVPFAAVGSQPSSQTAPGDDQAEEESLSLENLDLLDMRDGFAISEDTVFSPSDTVHLYFQVKGYRVAPQDRIHLSWGVEALDPQGRRFFPPDSGEVATELAPQDKGWMPIVRYSPRIPDHAGGGKYSIRISVRDELAGTELAHVVEVEVEGPVLRAADPLSVRGLRLTRQAYRRVASPEADLSPASVLGSDVEPGLVFQGGEEIVASFLITGFRVEADNRFEVECSAWVLDEDGELAAAFGSRRQTGRSSYPRQWLPAELSMHLQPDLRPGAYALMLEVRDAITGTVASERYPFSVR